MNFEVILHFMKKLSLYIVSNHRIFFQNRFIWVLKFCSLRGEGRRVWEGRVKNGVRMKHMITLASIRFSFC